MKTLRIVGLLTDVDDNVVCKFDSGMMRNVFKLFHVCFVYLIGLFAKPVLTS